MRSPSVVAEVGITVIVRADRGGGLQHSERRKDKLVVVMAAYAVVENSSRHDQPVGIAVAVVLVVGSGSVRAGVV